MDNQERHRLLINKLLAAAKRWHVYLNYAQFEDPPLALATTLQRQRELRTAISELMLQELQEEVASNTEL